MTHTALSQPPPHLMADSRQFFTQKFLWPLLPEICKIFDRFYSLGVTRGQRLDSPGAYYHHLLALLCRTTLLFQNHPT